MDNESSSKFDYSSDGDYSADACCLGYDLCEEDVTGTVLREGAKNGKGTSKTKGNGARNQQGVIEVLDEDLMEEELYSMGEDSDSDDTEVQRQIFQLQC